MRQEQSESSSFVDGLAGSQLQGRESSQRKTSTGGGGGAVRGEGGPGQQGGSAVRHDSSPSAPETQRETAPAKQTTLGAGDGGGTRFPKLEDCAHFHYDFVDFGKLQVALCEDERDSCRHKTGEGTVQVRVCCNGRLWTVRRSLEHFCSLDQQLHRCIFDRRFSHLPLLLAPDLQVLTAQLLAPDLQVLSVQVGWFYLPQLLAADLQVLSAQDLEQTLQGYLCCLSELCGPMVNCGSVLNWLEMDNRGNRLVALDTSGINTPAIAAAHAVKRYAAHAADEISLQVGDIVSLIDMPSRQETKWWRGKRGFEVGFFPSECVEVIGDKVPASMATVVPVATPAVAGALTGSSSTLTPPLTTPGAARKPCERRENVDDSASSQ
ncbi:hypothetical protein ACOMHN_044198 [Nucella lapillus]